MNENILELSTKGIYVAICTKLHYIDTKNDFIGVRIHKSGNIWENINDYHENEYKSIHKDNYKNNPSGSKFDVKVHIGVFQVSCGLNVIIANIEIATKNQKEWNTG